MPNVPICQKRGTVVDTSGAPSALATTVVSEILNQDQEIGTGNTHGHKPAALLMLTQTSMAMPPSLPDDTAQAWRPTLRRSSDELSARVDWI